MTILLIRKVNRWHLREVALLAEPRDLWVGVSWDFDRLGHLWTLTVFLCIVPCLPIRLTWGWR